MHLGLHWASYLVKSSVALILADARQFASPVDNRVGVHLLLRFRHDEEPSSLVLTRLLEGFSHLVSGRRRAVVLCILTCFDLLLLQSWRDELELLERPDSHFILYTKHDMNNRRNLPSQLHCSATAASCHG